MAMASDGDGNGNSFAIGNGKGKWQEAMAKVSARQKFLCTDSEIRGLATGGVLIRKIRTIHCWKSMEVSFPTPQESPQLEL